MRWGHRSPQRTSGEIVWPVAFSDDVFRFITCFTVRFVNAFQSKCWMRSWLVPVELWRNVDSIWKIKSRYQFWFWTSSGISFYWLHSMLYRVITTPLTPRKPLRRTYTLPSASTSLQEPSSLMPCSTPEAGVIKSPKGVPDPTIACICTTAFSFNIC